MVTQAVPTARGEGGAGTSNGPAPATSGPAGARADVSPSPAGSRTTGHLHDEKVLILDFGSQYTQLIARRVRELGVYCEIQRPDLPLAQVRAFAPGGIILSGGPMSVE